MATNRDLPSYFLRLRNIPHYYGDHIRALFLATAVLSVVVIPVYGDLIPFGTLVQICCATLLVLLGGLTSPHSTMVMWYDAIVAGLGTILLESAAINLYSADSIELFVAREVAALALMFAFYFSVKTLRAMSQDKLGKVARPWEFEKAQDTNEYEEQ
jgi:hypothetical protein